MQMQAIFMSEKLWDIVGTGTKFRPATLVVNDNISQDQVDTWNNEITEFNKKARKALKFIIPAIDNLLFYLWDGFPEDPRLLWQDLETYFQNQTHSHCVSICTQLDSLTLKEGRDNPEMS